MGNYGRWAEEVGSGEVRSTTLLRQRERETTVSGQQEYISRGLHLSLQTRVGYHKARLPIVVPAF